MNDQSIDGANKKNIINNEITHKTNDNINKRKIKDTKETSYIEIKDDNIPEYH